MSQVLLASLYRGGFEEVTVFGELLVVENEATVFQAQEAVGCYPVRSLLKPFQFLTCDLKNTEDLRYTACLGSISATKDQVAQMDQWYGTEPLSSLVKHTKVPASFPMDSEMRVLAKAHPLPKYHTCFSKHASILEACEKNGWEKSTYTSENHPFQQALLQVLGNLLGRDLSNVVSVVDGCGLPTPVLSIREMAKLYWLLGTADDKSELGSLKKKMLENPDWIGGSDRTDTKLMKANPGRVLAKEGADGLLGISVLPGKGAPKGLGIIFKVSHGYDMKTAAWVVSPFLESLGLKGVGQIPQGQTVRHHYLENKKRKWLDISPTLSSKIAVWPGDVSFKRVASHETLKGSHMTLSSIETTLHVGAHTDGPNHFEPQEAGIESVAIEKYLGPCQVLHLKKKRGELIAPKDWEGKEILAKRVLFRTDSYPDPTHFNEDFVALSKETIEALKICGVILVGIDTPSIDFASSKELAAHHATQAAGMGILEGIVLAGIEEGIYELSAIPLRIEKGDASPVRALLRPLG